jgi:phosphoglycerol transferase MdoB-like AlkP superfamily enzyme
MKNYYLNIQLLFRRLIYLFVLYFISRLFFFFINYHQFSYLSLYQLVVIFLGGARFDFASIIFTNAVFFLLHIVPGGFKNNRKLQQILTVAFFAVNMLFILTNFIDAKYFDFTEKRTSSEIFSLFGFNNDVLFLVPRFIKDYWYVPLSFAALAVASWFCLPKLKFEKLNAEHLKIKPFIFQFAIMTLILGIFLWAVRGAGLRPIGIRTAANYTETRSIPLILNTPFTIIKSTESKQISEYKFFDKGQLSAIYDPIRNPGQKGELKRKNVVIIILESFSKEYIGSLNNNEGYTPFLDSLIRYSLICDQAFANGKRSVEGIPSVITSIPTLMEDSYLTSSYVTNEINSIASILDKEGYHSAFFHGGNKGTMGFEDFSKIAGYDEFFGRKEYNNDKDYDGHWGIRDEEFLQYFAKKMNSFHQPFVTTVFTLSSHHPYLIPDKYKGKFKPGKLPIHQSIRYSDYSLKQFFETASKMPWFKNTIFAITADHTAQSISKFYSNKLGMYAVPIIYYAPGDSTLRGRCHTITQQIDMMPTILSYLNYNKPYVAFGENLFDKSARHYSISYLSGVFQIIEDDAILQFDGEKSIAFYQLKNDSLLKNNLLVQPIKDAKTIQTAMGFEKQLKAILQSYSNRIINNRLIVK